MVVVDWDKLARLIELLDDDARVFTPSGDPLDELVGTILSQATRDSEAVYRALRARYPTWEALRDAPEEAIVAIIRAGGLARVKARRIKLALGFISEECGDFDLGFLADWPLSEARRWLSGVPGVGPKTAACVLLFGLGRPVLPVDEHVHRCATRLGLVSPGATPAASHAALEIALAGDLHATYLLHTRLHRLSRAVCRPHAPQCAACPLAPICDYV